MKQDKHRLNVILTLIVFALLGGLAPRAEAEGVQKSVFSVQYSEKLNTKLCIWNLNPKSEH